MNRKVIILILFPFFACQEGSKDKSKKVMMDTAQVQTFEDSSFFEKNEELYQPLFRKDLQQKIKEKERLFMKAQSLFSYKRFLKAKNIYDKLIQERILDYETVLKIAEQYVDVPHPYSLELCDKLIQLDTQKNDPKPYFLKAIYFQNTNNISAAIQYLDKAIITKWSFIEAFIQKGIIFFSQKKYSDAYEILKKARTINHSHPDIYYWLGRCEENLEQQQQAKLNYQRALFFDPKFKEAQNRLSKLNENKD